ncbi:MAG: DUF1801 domain-containing protein [Acidimicrobiia bacterium]|nr:DUF1801 domain-containing protein [Acidimicrobiia bacterium]NNL27276.1 DUF1801 domain-containing protein [Acidimicrobiia bacterium]
MSDYVRHPGVDEYLDALPQWQKSLCRDLRDLIHDVDGDMAETVKRRVQPYFVLEGNVCALLGTRDHVNLFLYDGAIVPDPDGIITGGHGNKTARMISFYEGDAIPEASLHRMITRIVANNRAGGWRKLKAAEEQRRG